MVARSGDGERLLTAACGEACGVAGFPAGPFRLLRHFATAVYVIERVPVVARVAYGPNDAERSRRAVTVTAWLAGRGVPVTEPAPLPSGASQPIVVTGGGRTVAVTFWHYHPQPVDQQPVGPQAVGPCARGIDDVVALARIARTLHGVTDPAPIPLPAYRPLTSLRGAVTAARSRGSIEVGVLDWLDGEMRRLLGEYDRLSFPLGTGLIHGDLHAGNLLRTGGTGAGPVVLGDWDSVGIGPREIDLVPSYAATRFGVDSALVDRFAAAYGHDLRDWPGHRVLRAIRDLSTLTALVRLAPANPASARELAHRLDTLRRGDTNAVWNPQ